jgi:hypothetical protein
MTEKYCHATSCDSIRIFQTAEELSGEATGRLLALIDALPDRLKADYDLNRKGFDGNTSEMSNASFNMVRNLEQIWTGVVTAGVPKEELRLPRAWIESYAERQWGLYESLYWPDKGGLFTIVLHGRADRRFTDANRQNRSSNAC